MKRICVFCLVLLIFISNSALGFAEQNDNHVPEDLSYWVSGFNPDGCMISQVNMTSRDGASEPDRISYYCFIPKASDASPQMYYIVNYSLEGKLRGIIFTCAAEEEALRKVVDAEYSIGKPLLCLPIERILEQTMNFYDYRFAEEATPIKDVWSSVFLMPLESALVSKGSLVSVNWNRAYDQLDSIYFSWID